MDVYGGLLAREGQAHLDGEYLETFLLFNSDQIPKASTLQGFPAGGEIEIVWGWKEPLSVVSILYSSEVLLR